MNLTPQPAPAPPTTIFASGECGNCGTYIGLFIHNVRLRGIQRKLCTSCVLRLHPSSFCPICFTFYDSNPPHPSKRLSCAKCGSFTHSHCAKPLALSSPYHCPPCSDPKNFNFFKNHPAKSTNTDPNPNTTGNMRSDDDKNAHVIDSKSAAVLLCAARIAAASMEKAVLVARIEEEKKAKEAAAARKRAREALEHVGVLIISHLKPTLDVTRKDQIQSLCELPCNIQDTRELLATTKLQLHNLVPQAMSLPRPSRKPQLKPSTLDLRLPVPRLIQLKRNARLRRLRSKSHPKGAISLTNTPFDSFTLNQYRVKEKCVPYPSSDKGKKIVQPREKRLHLVDPYFKVVDCNFIQVTCSKKRVCVSSSSKSWSQDANQTSKMPFDVTLVTSMVRENLSDKVWPWFWELAMPMKLKKFIEHNTQLLSILPFLYNEYYLGLLDNNNNKQTCNLLKEELEDTKERLAAIEQSHKVEIEALQLELAAKEKILRQRDIEIGKLQSELMETSKLVALEKKRANNEKELAHQFEAQLEKTLLEKTELEGKLIAMKAMIENRAKDMLFDVFDAIWLQYPNHN